MQPNGLAVSAAVEPPSASTMLVPLSPPVACLFGAWYSLTAAAASSFGFKSLSAHGPDAHYFLSSLAWVVGAGIGAGLAAFLSAKLRVLVGCLSAVLPALQFPVSWLFMGNGELQPIALGVSPSVKSYALAFMCATITAGLLAGICVQNVLAGPESCFAERMAAPSYLKRHLYWLWIAVFMWISTIPAALYYLWLEITTTSYIIVHPRLWLETGTWQTSMFGLAPGLFGIAVLLYGIQISFEAVFPAAPRPTGKRVLVFLLGTGLLVSVIGPILINIGIDHLKAMPLVRGSNAWWIL